MAVNSPAPAPASRSRRALWLLALVPLMLGGLWWGGGAEEPGPDEAAGASSTPAPSRSSGSGAAKSVVAAAPVAPGKGPAPAAPSRSREEEEREAKRALWEKRLERAKFSLESYVAGTRYPPESRPIREHPDQEQLASPERTQPLERDSSDVQLKLKQEKVFVAGDEVVHFYVGCENVSRQPLPCQVTNASAHEAEHALGGQAPLAAVPLSFVDDGTQGDVLARDGTSTASFQPSKQGFPMFSGTLRVSFQVRSGSAEGSAFFDILYTPAPPARFTGKVREAVEHGSLHLYLGLQVRTAGRYVVAGRVDDEAGMPFAYVSFNEELPAGAQEVEFVVFGKLILDEAPTFPLKLRDVEGFLLKERGDPDRELLNTLQGYVHTTREYPTTVFSAEEWQSEERSRYINRFTEDVKEAQQELDALAGRPGSP
ncbi:choice-of-anchor X domain-containing protein [Hyalangium gracile]|uniref:choice-of-anchor X domain-containing protein n=1 Tax=Hyalangium gracile TaxID=394092 RepID=UPI001CCD67A6|nr:choice-of-anchor X domain-containing protein [Hyalangium gracile]